MAAEPAPPGDVAGPGRTVSVAEAKAHLSQLLKAVERGEVISITRRGEPVATLSAASRPKQPIDIQRLRRLTAGMTYSDVSAVDIVREMRDSRY